MPSPNLTLLDYANSAIRHVKFSCPIGAYTSDEDVKKTRGDNTPVSWVEFMGKTLQGRCKVASQNWSRDIGDAKSLVAEWRAQLRVEDKSSEEIYTQENAHLYIWHQIAEKAHQMKCGTCAEQAIVAFIYWLKCNVVPLAFFKTKNADHGFCVLGLPQEYYPNDFKTWGDAVICDPFNSLSFKAKDATPAEIKKILGDNANTCFQLIYRQDRAVYRDDKGKKSETPNIPLSLCDVYKKLIELTRAFKNPAYIPLINRLSLDCNHLDGLNKFIQLSDFNRVNEEQMLKYLAELKQLQDKPANEATSFFQRVTKPPALDKKIQAEICSFSFRR